MHHISDVLADLAKRGTALRSWVRCSTCRQRAEVEPSAVGQRSVGEMKCPGRQIASRGNFTHKVVMEMRGLEPLTPAMRTPRHRYRQVSPAAVVSVNLAIK